MQQHSLPSAPLFERDLLITQHNSYVRALAIEIMRGLPLRVDLQELIAYGQIGLIEAAERYDPRRGVTFSTFAYYRIKGAIYDGMREMGYLSRSAYARKKARFQANANDLLRAGADDEPQPQAGEESTVDDEIVRTQSLIDGLIPVYLLSINSDSVGPDVIDKHALSMEQIEQRELIGLFLPLITKLSTDEQQLIDALYFKYMSMTSLAAQMGISKSWISRLHARAIKHLRDLMEQHGLLNAPL